MRDLALTSLTTVALLALSACAALPLGRGAGASPFATRLCGVVIDAKRVVRLRIELTPTSRLAPGTFVEAQFENPEGGTPLTAGRTLTGGERTLEIVSPPMKDVRPRNYEVVTRLYRSADRKQILGIHTQACESLIDQREF